MFCHIQDNCTKCIGGEGVGGSGKSICLDNEMTTIVNCLMVKVQGFQHVFHVFRNIGEVRDVVLNFFKYHTIRINSTSSS